MESILKLKLLERQLRVEYLEMFTSRYLKIQEEISQILSQMLLASQTTNDMLSTKKWSCLHRQLIQIQEYSSMELSLFQEATKDLVPTTVSSLEY